MTIAYVTIGYCPTEAMLADCKDETFDQFLVCLARMKTMSLP